MRFKAYLRWLRDQTSIIKYLFRGFGLLYPALLVMVFALSGPPSDPVVLSAAVILVLMVAVRFSVLNRFDSLLHGIIYLIVPYGVYLSEQWVAGQPLLVARGYHLLFGLVALLNILVSKLTRRKEGFKSTPLDFLIFFLAAAPLLPVASGPDIRMGLVAAKVIIMYYGCEVLMAEQRGKHSLVSAGVATSMAILVYRWFI